MKIKNLLRKLKTASAFSPAQWKVFGEAYLLFLRVRFLLIFSPAESVEKALSNKIKPSDKPSHFQKRELLALFRIAQRYQLGRPNCLPVSVTQHFFLTRYHYPTRLRIGVRKENGKLKAHAWCIDPQEAKDTATQEQNPFHELDPLDSSPNEAAP